MLNFVFNKVSLMVLIVCSCNIMEPVELKHADLSMKKNQAGMPSKFLRGANNNLSTNLRLSKLSPCSIRHVPSHRKTDNPNNEQKLMVEAFLKSSNSLFERETDVMDHNFMELEEVVEPLKLKLHETPKENNAVIKTELAKEKSKELSRYKRFSSYYKVATIRPLDHVRNELGGRRCDHGRLANGSNLPKERILRSGRNNYIKQLYKANRRYEVPEIKWSRRSSYRKRRFVRDEMSKNKKLDPLKNSFKRTNIVGSPLDTIEKFFGLGDPMVEELRHPPSFFTIGETDKIKNGIKWLCKRQYVNDECRNPMKRLHCKKRLTTICRKSVNEGKTGKINFPSTHRCIRVGTCPCSVGYVKCPSRTTCPEVTHPCYMPTLGRCHGIDDVLLSPLPEDMCPTKPKGEEAGRSETTQRARRSCLKRCSCGCGCGCPSDLQRVHPDRALHRESCGCGCGCGCLHGHSGRCGVEGSRPSNT